MKRPSSRHRDKAVALRYREKEDTAPTVVAKGEGFIAQTMRETAIKHGIPLRRDDDLIELLAQVEIDRQIPPELNAAVAELLSWVYRANEFIKKESRV